VEGQRIKVANILRQFHFPRSGRSCRIPTVTDHSNKVTKCGKKAKVNHVVMLPCLNYNEKDSGQELAAHAHTHTHTHSACVTLFRPPFSFLQSPFSTRLSPSCNGECTSRFCLIEGCFCRCASSHSRSFLRSAQFPRVSPSSNSSVPPHPTSFSDAELTGITYLSEMGSSACHFLGALLH